MGKCGLRLARWLEQFAGFDEESVGAEVAFTEHLQAAGIRLLGSVASATGRIVVPVQG